MRPVIFKRTRLIVVLAVLFFLYIIFYKWHTSVNLRGISDRDGNESLSQREKTEIMDSEDKLTENEGIKNRDEKIGNSFDTENEIKENDSESKESEQETNKDQDENEQEDENEAYSKELEEPKELTPSKNTPETEQENQVNIEKEQVIVVLVIACNRPEYVKKCIDTLLEKRPADLKAQFPIVVSQDCGHEETEKVIASYGNKLKLIKQPDLSAIHGVAAHMVGYYKLSRHYKWALGQIFDVMGFDAAVIVEDDLEIAPDFYDYFAATRPLLDQDPTIWCVSAWNDNGKEECVKDNGLLFRSDFFPGLGWMLKRSLWNELRPKWPNAFWDDWMRNPEQRQDRCCIRPEICRTKTFGENGVSQGQFYLQHLQYIKLNDKFFHFRNKDLSYLLKDSYDSDFHNHAYMIPSASFSEIKSGKVSTTVVRVQYEDNSSFESLAKQFGIMSDLKSGVPRMAYRGIVVFIYKGIRVFLAPPDQWTGYE